MSNKSRESYINSSVLKIAALIHLIAGSAILVLSGIVLFSLPAIVFYMTFLFGFYLFLPGVLITFGLVGRSGARSWAKIMVPIWRWIA